MARAVSGMRSGVRDRRHLEQRLIHITNTFALHSQEGHGWHEIWKPQLARENRITEISDLHQFSKSRTRMNTDDGPQQVVSSRRKTVPVAVVR